MIVFDIETGPLPDTVLADRVEEPKPAPPPQPFDPSNIKTGNLRDQDKIDAKIEQARQKHQLACDSHTAKVEEDRQAFWADIREKAPLNPLHGRVLAIGYYSTDTEKTCLDIQEDEGAMLTHFWTRYQQIRGRRQLVGHNVFGFDIPFLVKRSWLLGLDVPPKLFSRGRWIDNETFADTMLLWSAGGKIGGKLDALARAMGVGSKPEGVDGAMFADLLLSDRKAAEAYLRNDLYMTCHVAQRMGLI